MKQSFYLLLFFFLCFFLKNEINAQNCTAYAGEDTLVCGLQYQLVGNGYGSWMHACDSDTIPPIDFVLVDDSTANVTASAYGLHQFIFTLYQNSCSPPENTDTVLVFFYPKTISTGTSDVTVTIEMQGDCPSDQSVCLGSALPFPENLTEPNPVYTITGTTNTTTTYFTSEAFGDTLNCVVDSVAVITHTIENNSSSSGEVVWNGDNADDVWDEIDDAVLQADGEMPANLNFPPLGSWYSLFCPTLPDTVEQTLDSTFSLLPIKVGGHWNYTPIEETPDTVFVAFYPNNETFNLDSMVYYSLDSTLISSSPDVFEYDTLNAYGVFQFDWIDIFEYDTLWRYFLTPTLPACPDCDSGMGSSINLPPPPPQPTCSFIGEITPPDEEIETYVICEWDEFVLPDGTVISGWDNGWGTQTHSIFDAEECKITEYVIQIEPIWYQEEYAQICEGDTYTDWWSGQTFSEAGYYFLNWDWCSEVWLNLEVSPLPEVFATSTDANCGQCDGSASITVNGGAAPYSYLWNDANAQTTTTATNLCAGDYCVTVTDANGCFTEACVEISNTLGLQVTSTPIDATCGQCNGSITMEVLGGIPPYTYLGDDLNEISTTDLCVGEYTVYVTDDVGCTGSTYVTIEETQGTINETENVTICDWDSYTLADGTVVSESGDYIVTINNTEGCDSTITTILEVAEPLEVNVATTDASCGQCNGSMDIEIVGGTPPYEYPASWTDWSVEPTNELCAGMYDILVTDAINCSNSVTVTIEETTDLLETPNAICAESTAESITIVWNSVENALAYVVSYENMSDTTTQTSYTITNLEAETNLDISVTAIGIGNCSISEIETINCISGQNNANIITFNIPNTVVFPTVFSPNEDGQNDEFKVIGTDIKNVSMNIYNRWGTLVFESHDLTKTWNGKYQNKACEIGVYFYHAIVTFEDESVQQHKGNLTLVR